MGLDTSQRACSLDASLPCIRTYGCDSAGAIDDVKRLKDEIEQNECARIVVIKH